MRFLVTSKLLAGAAVALALTFGAGGASAQQAVVQIDSGAPANAVVEAPTTALAHDSADAAPSSTGSARAARRARRDDAPPKGNVVTSTLAGVPGLVGHTVGGGLSKAGSTIGGALGVGH